MSGGSESNASSLKNPVPSEPWPSSASEASLTDSTFRLIEEILSRSDNYEKTEESLNIKAPGDSTNSEEVGDL